MRPVYRDPGLHRSGTPQMAGNRPWTPTGGRNQSAPGQHLRIRARSPRQLGVFYKLSRSSPTSKWKLVLYYHPAW